MRKFKSNILIDIREYFEKNGELLPTKKGNDNFKFFPKISYLCCFNRSISYEGDLGKIEGIYKGY